MKPVMQTSFYHPGAPEKGNCWSACVASLLELDIEQVPNFVEIEDLGGKNWWEHTVDFLWERGYVIQMVDPLDLEWDTHYIQCGKSPRFEGIYHSVIYINGYLVHDPFPGGTGVGSHDDAYVIKLYDESDYE